MDLWNLKQHSKKNQAILKNMSENFVYAKCKISKRNGLAIIKELDGWDTDDAITIYKNYKDFEDYSRKLYKEEAEINDRDFNEETFKEVIKWEWRCSFWINNLFIAVLA